MAGDPEAFDGFVLFEQSANGDTLRPYEAEVLAMDLLGAASKARAQAERQEAEHERDTALGMLARVLPEAVDGADVGHSDPAPEHEGQAGTSYRRVWFRSPRHPPVAAHIPAELVPSTVPEDEVPAGVRDVGPFELMEQLLREENEPADEQATA